MLPWALDRLVRMSAAHKAPTGPSRLVIPPVRFQTVAVSITTREWRGRQDLGMSGSERADAGTDPKVGGPAVPARWQPEDCYASGPPGRPEGQTRIGRIGVGRPEGRPWPRPDPDPEGCGSEPGKIPRESPVTGPFHPKVLGLRHIAPRLRRVGRDPALSPEGLAPVFERDPEAPSPLVPEGTDVTWHGARPPVDSTHHPKTMGKSTCHSSGPPFRVSTEPCAATPEEVAPRGEPSPTRRWGAVRDSGPAPASWR